MKKGVVMLIGMLFILVPLVAHAADDSQLPASCAPPTVLEVGKRYSIGVSFMNVGDTPWTKADGYSLSIISAIGTECTGYNLSNNEVIAKNQTKTFSLSCIPIPGEETKSTITVRMIHNTDYFGETGIPCTIYSFRVVNHCQHNAINGFCNKYCGASTECHNHEINASIDPGDPSQGFCDFECRFLDSTPEETTITIATTTTTSITLQTGIECPEGYIYEEGLCIYHPDITMLCPAGSTYSEVYDSCIVQPTLEGICPAGYVLDGAVCIYTPRSQVECPAGSTYSEEKEVCVFYASAETSCPAGYELVGRMCRFRREDFFACPAGSAYSEQAGACVAQPVAKVVCSDGFVFEDSMCVYRPSATEQCPKGSTYSQEKASCMLYPDASNACPEGYVLEDGLCLYRPAFDLQCPAGSKYSAAKNACVVYVDQGAYCPLKFELKDNLCIYNLSKTCGNGIVDGSELCDYNAEPTAWTAQKLSCSQGMSASLRTCSLNCEPVYYPARCAPGKCSADCSQDSECNDGDAETEDSCSSCRCSHAYNAANGSKKTLAVLKVMIAILVIASVVLFVIYKHMSRGKKNESQN